MRTRLSRALLLALVLSLAAHGQVTRGGGGGASINSYTVATLPGTSTVGTLAIVTDASTAGSCSVGGGSALSLCRWSGSAWLTVGGSGGSGTVINTYLVSTLPAAPAANTLAVVTDSLTSGSCVSGGGSLHTMCQYNSGWLTVGTIQAYPGSGIAVSTGSAWGTSLVAPSGTIVGTTDTQTLTNKSIAASEINSGVLASSVGGTGVNNTATLTLGSANHNYATLGTGIIKNTTTTGALSVAASVDITGLFSGCSGTLLLGADGSCHAGGGVNDPGSNGFVVRTALNTTVARSLVAASGIIITDPTGVGASPTIGIDPSVVVTSVTADNVYVTVSGGTSPLISGVPTLPLFGTPVAGCLPYTSVVGPPIQLACSNYSQNSNGQVVLASGEVFTPSTQNPTAGAVQLDFAAGNYIKTTLGQNTVATAAHLVAGSHFLLEITPGGFSFTYPSGFSNNCFVDPATTWTLGEYIWDGSNAKPISCTSSEAPLELSGPTKAVPATPASGFGKFYFDSTSNLATYLNSAGNRSATFPSFTASANQFVTAFNPTTGAVSQAQASFAGLSDAPAFVRPGDIFYRDSGGVLRALAGNNSGTLFLQENSSGVPSWASTAASIAWNSISDPTGNFLPSMGANLTRFTYSSSLTSAMQWYNSTAASSGTSQSGPTLDLSCGNEWHAAASTKGCVSLQFIPGNGTDAASTVAITHTGSATGAMTVSVPSALLAGTLPSGLSAVVCGSGGCFIGEEGTTPSAGFPAAGIGGLVLNSAAHNILWSMNNSVLRPIALFNAAPIGGSCLQTSGTAGIIVETGSACGTGGSFPASGIAVSTGSAWDTSIAYTAPAVTLPAGGSVGSADTGSPSVAFSTNSVTINQPLTVSGSTHGIGLPQGTCSALVANQLNVCPATSVQAAGISYALPGTEAAGLVNFTVSSHAETGAFVTPSSGTVLHGTSATAMSFSAIVVGDLPGSGATTINGFSCTMNSTCTVSGGVNTRTTSYTITSADIGHLVLMNCSGACAATLPAAPGSGFYVDVESIGSTTATISLNSLNFNGTSSVPVLNKFRPVRIYSDGVNYFGDAPLVAGTNVTFTAASASLTIAASGGGGGASSLDQLTGAAALATITEVAAGDIITFAGVETAAATYPYVFQNLSNSNNAGGALIINTKGTGNAQIPLIINETTAAGVFAKFTNGGTVTNGVYTGGTTEWSVDASGNSSQGGSVTSGTPPTCTPGTGGGFPCASEGTATTISGSQSELYASSTYNDWAVRSHGSSTDKLLGSTAGYKSGSVSASIGSTNVVASGDFPTGQYLVNCDVIVTAVGSSPTLAVTLGWTDANGTSRTKTCTTGVVTVSDNPVTQTITSNGTAALTVTQTLAVSTATWQTFVAVTRLQ